MPARWLTLAALSWAAAAAATVLAVGNAILAALGQDLDAYPVPIALGFAWMGCALLARLPGHLMGPLLCLIGLANAVSGAAFAYARYALVHMPGSPPLATPALWLNTWLYAPALSLTGLVLPLVFPEGRLLSARWRPALWAALALIPLWAVGFAFVPQNMGSYFRDLPDPYTYPSLEPLFRTAQVLAVLCGLTAGAAAVASVVLRWRRADRVGRQQLKWFFAVLPLAAAAMIIQVTDPGSGAAVGLGALAGALMPVGIGVAVLRYRLYEIDVLLSRAVLYALLTAGVAGVYVAVVTVAEVVFGRSGHSMTVQVLATAVGAAALFPLRDRVQRRVDRLFYGDRGVPYEALARLGRRVEESGDTDSALNSVVKTIADSLRLPYAALELRLADGWRQAAAYGHAPAEVTTFPLISQRETVGRLVAGTRSPGERLGPDDVRLLADLARQAGPAHPRGGAARGA